MPQTSRKQVQEKQVAFHLDLEGGQASSQTLDNILIPRGKSAWRMGTRQFPKALLRAVGRPGFTGCCEKRSMFSPSKMGLASRKKPDCSSPLLVAVALRPPVRRVGTAAGEPGAEDPTLVG